MKITNLLHFTENHRFYIFRDFSLSSMDYKMLSNIYQPMVGAYATSVYTLLYQQIPSDQAGYSTLEQQRRLFLALELEPSERGRQYFIEQTSKLEAIGLLQTSRKYVPDSDDYMYEYQLSAPLSPNEFFRNQHLTMLLRDKVGKYQVLSYREEFTADMPEELLHREVNSENLSLPFYEVFQLNTQVIDYELEQALIEMAPTREVEQPEDPLDKGFQYAEIIMRFPRESYNRIHVENLKFEQDQLTAINYIASKYKLSLQEICRLLDEDGVFSEDGELQTQLMQQIANLHFRQGKKRDDEHERYMHKVDRFQQTAHSTVNLTAVSAIDSEVEEEKPVEMEFYLEVPLMFMENCDIHQYNMLLRNEPYTRVLKRFFPGSVPDRILDIFEKIDLNYKLSEEVINVLIHYLKVENLSWTKPFIESIASDMLGKQIGSYEQAVKYTRDVVKSKAKSSARASKGSTRGRSMKPLIPIISNQGNEIPVTEEEYEEIIRKAQQLDEKMR